MGRSARGRGAVQIDDASHLAPNIAWQALMADHEGAAPGALESLRPWLLARAQEMVDDRQLAALVAQQVLVDLAARAGQAIHSPEQLEHWLRVRLTQTVSLFTGGVWISSPTYQGISSSIPSALALGAGWTVATWARRMFPTTAIRLPPRVGTSATAALAIALIAFAMTSSFSAGGTRYPSRSTPDLVSPPGGVPVVIAPITVVQPPAPAQLTSPPVASAVAVAPPTVVQPPASVPQVLPTAAPVTVALLQAGPASTTSTTDGRRSFQSRPTPVSSSTAAPVAAAPLAGDTQGQSGGLSPLPAEATPTPPEANPTSNPHGRHDSGAPGNSSRSNRDGSASVGWGGGDSEGHRGVSDIPRR